MAFTTWADLQSQMLDALAAGDWHRREFELGDQRVTYNSFAEFRRALDYVRHHAALEDGRVVGRTYARQGGRA